MPRILLCAAAVVALLLISALLLTPPGARSDSSALALTRSTAGEAATETPTTTALTLEGDPSGGASGERTLAEAPSEAQGSAGQAAPSGGSSSTVTGRVVDPRGLPRSGARVTVAVADRWTREGTTEVDGTFAVQCPIQRAPIAVLTVQASLHLAGPRVRFGSATGAQFGPLDIPLVDVGDITQGPGATLVGRVCGPAGGPIEGALLRAPSEDLRATSDAAGAFSLHGLAGGATKILVSAPERIARELSVSADPGETLRLGDVVLELGPLVRGHVVDAEGKAIPSASIVAGGTQQPARPDGSFEFRVPAAKGATLYAAAPGYRNSVEQLPRSEFDMRFVLHRAGEVCRFVVVNAKTREPVAGADVALVERRQNDVEPLGSISPRPAIDAAGNALQTAADGSIELQGLAGIDGIQVRADGFKDYNGRVRDRATQGSTQTLRLQPRTTASIVGSVPQAGNAQPRDTVHVQVLERGQLSDSGSYFSWSQLPRRVWQSDEAGAVSAWLGSQPILRTVETLVARTGPDGTFGVDCPPNVLARAVVRRANGGLLVSPVVAIKKGEAIDVGALVPTQAGSIVAKLRVPSELLPHIELRLGDQPASKRAPNEHGLVAFANLLPGRYALSKESLPRVLQREDFLATVDVTPGNQTDVEFAADVPELGSVEFALIVNGEAITSSYTVFLSCKTEEGHDSFVVSSKPPSHTAGPTPLPVHSSYVAAVRYQTTSGAIARCELPYSVRVRGGPQRIELPLAASRVTCVPPPNWSPPERGDRARLAWTDGSGISRAPIAARRLSVGGGLEGGGLDGGGPIREVREVREIYFDSVPCEATKLKLVVDSEDRSTPTIWPFEVELVPGGDVRVQID